MTERIGWPALLSALLVAAVVILAWLARRPVVIGAAALAAGAAAGYAGFSSGQIGSYVVTELACLAAVVVLTMRMERRSPAGLWLIFAVVAALFLPGSLQYVAPPLWLYIAPNWLYIVPGMELCVVVVALAWIAIDARPLVV